MASEECQAHTDLRRQDQPGKTISHDIFSSEKGNTYGSKRGQAVLFGSKHQHRETECRSDEHLNEHRLSAVDIQSGKCTKWKQILDKRSRADTGKSENRGKISTRTCS